MLEANAQCGLSEDENYTSIGAILKASNVSFTEVIGEILKDALRRSVVKTVSVKKVPVKKLLRKRRLRLNKFRCHSCLMVMFIYFYLLP